jgi:hypothetical protein
MAVYEVLIHGTGLRIPDEEGGVQEGGVYVWRVVTAENETSAVRRAQEAVLSDPVFLDELRNEALDEVSLAAEEILERSAESGYVDTGFVFYIEEDED